MVRIVEPVNGAAARLAALLAPLMTSPALPGLLALIPLDDLPRTGWLQHGVQPGESIADHVLGTCFVALALAPRVEPTLDTDRAIALALVHDAAEVELSDLPQTASRRLPPGLKASIEDAIAAEVLPPVSDLALERYREYRSGASREARLVRLCDRLHMGVRLVAYHRRGVRGLESFRATVAALDCSEFAPALALQREILDALA